MGEAQRCQQQRVGEIRGSESEMNPVVSLCDLRVLSGSKRARGRQLNVLDSAVDLQAFNDQKSSVVMQRGAIGEGLDGLEDCIT